MRFFSFRVSFMKNILTILIAIVASVVVVKFMNIDTGTVEAKKESVYERVMRTGVLRCGYYLFPPVMSKDANTGALSGFAKDLMDIVGKNTSLKVDWVEEVGFGEMFAGLATGRYDAICTPVWPDSANARVAQFAIPLMYSAIGAYTRYDELRFDGIDLKTLNNPRVTLAVTDGSIDMQIARTNFPKAKTYAISQSAPTTDLELSVITKKADISFHDYNRAKQYMDKNPNSLKKISSEPVKIFPFRVAVNVNALKLKLLLDVAFEEVLNNGVVDKLIDKHELFHGSFLRVAKPYQQE